MDYEAYKDTGALRQMINEYFNLSLTQDTILSAVTFYANASVLYVDIVFPERDYEEIFAQYPESHREYDFDRIMWPLGLEEERERIEQSLDYFYSFHNNAIVFDGDGVTSRPHYLAVTKSSDGKIHAHLLRYYHDCGVGPG